MYCNKCGDPVESNERFCNKCGNKLEVEPLNQTFVEPPKSNDNKLLLLP